MKKSGGHSSKGLGTIWRRMAGNRAAAGQLLNALLADFYSACLPERLCSRGVLLRRREGYRRIPCEAEK